MLFSATHNDELDLEAKLEFIEEADLLQREQIFLNGKLSDRMPSPFKNFVHLMGTSTDQGGNPSRLLFE